MEPNDAICGRRPSIHGDVRAAVDPILDPIDPPTAERLAKKRTSPLLVFQVLDSSQHRNMRLQVFADSAVAKEMKGNDQHRAGVCLFFPTTAIANGVPVPGVADVWGWPQGGIAHVREPRPDAG